MTLLDVLCRTIAPTPDGTPHIPDDIEWDRLLDAAVAHGLVHHFGDALTSRDDVPEEVVSTVRSRRRSQAARSLQLTNALDDILLTFRDASVDALPYKGPVLSVVAHGDVATRSYADLDLLVAPSDFEQACSLLEESGYREVERLRGLGEAAYSNETTTIDIHRAVLPRYFPGQLSVDGLWRRRATVDVGGRSVPAFDPVDRFVVLAVHGTKHCWYRLEWIHDVATLLAADRTDWRAVQALAKDCHCLRHVYLACWLASRSFGVAVPTPLDPTADPVVADLGRWIDDQCISVSPSPPSDRTQFSVQWRALARRRDRLRYAVRVATIPSEDDIQRIPLPDKFSPLYRVLRPVRLLANAGRREASSDR